MSGRLLWVPSEERLLMMHGSNSKKPARDVACYGANCSRDSSGKPRHTGLAAPTLAAVRKQQRSRASGSPLPSVRFP
jgi:hypothetical protein